MQLIYVVRHGETDANVAGMVNDKNVVIPLNNNGIKQAKKTGIYFKKIRNLNSSNCCIYSSPSVRAIQTAELIAKELKYNKSIIQDDRLIEVDHGDKSGAKNTDTVAKKSIKLFNEFLKDVKNDPIDTELGYPAFDKKMQKIFHMETTENIEKRTLNFMKMIFNKKTKHIVLVTHNGIIYNIRKNLFNFMPLVTGDISNGKNCTIMCIKNQKKTIELITLPNTLHLAMV
jgi:broad specificity phosphatase PhoE